MSMKESTLKFRAFCELDIAVVIDAAGGVWATHLLGVELKKPVEL